MKVVILCKSDTKGGAAIASLRLMEALRTQGVDARMLVVDKHSRNPYVEKLTDPLLNKTISLFERLRIFFSNGRNRSTLFQIDTGEIGLPLWKHPLVTGADAVLIGWINQGMLSVRGIGKICKSGKPVVWTMHDMWSFTGICHHAGSCRHYMEYCGNCHLLHSMRKEESDKAFENDLSHKIWIKKDKLYKKYSIKFVAVSSWVKEKAKASSLLGKQAVTVISNPFPTHEIFKNETKTDKKGIIFGAARLDDPVKGFDILIESLTCFKKSYPVLAGQVELILFGSIKNPELLHQMPISYSYRGSISGRENIKKIYEEGAVVLSTSRFETSGNTLVEGQAFGCVPVAFSRGGQGDIISHLENGFLAEWSENAKERAQKIADGLAWALSQSDEIRDKMRENVEKKFSYSAIANKYIELIESTIVRNKERVAKNEYKK